MKKLTIAALLTLALTSCYSQRVLSDAYINGNEKTILVSRGHDDVLATIKEVLKEEGWKTRVKTAETTEKVSETKMIHTGNHETAYSLWFKWTFIDYEFPTFRKMYDIEMGIVNNATGEECLSLYADNYTCSRFKGLLKKALQEYTQP